MKASDHFLPSFVKSKTRTLRQRFARISCGEACVCQSHSPLFAHINYSPLLQGNKDCNVGGKVSRAEMWTTCSIQGEALNLWLSHLEHTVLHDDFKFWIRTKTRRENRYTTSPDLQFWQEARADSSIHSWKPFSLWQVRAISTVPRIAPCPSLSFLSTTTPWHIRLVWMTQRATSAAASFRCLYVSSLS